MNKKITHKFGKEDLNKRSINQSQSQGLRIKGLATLSKKRFFKLRSIKDTGIRKENQFPVVLDRLTKGIGHKQLLEKKKKFNSTVSFNRIVKRDFRDKDFEKGAMVSSRFMDRFQRHTNRN